MEILRHVKPSYCNFINFNVHFNHEGGRMHEYVFKMKKGDIEIELKSDDLEFVEEQLNKWRDELLQDNVK